MNRRRSLLKIAALRSERERQEGVKMGYGQSITSASVTALIGSPVSIGTGDFTLEYFGNSYGSATAYSSLMFNAAHRDVYSTGSLFVYSVSGKGIGWIVFEKPSSGDALLDSIDLMAGEAETLFHFVLTRKGTTVKAYFNGELKATKEQSAVKDLGDFRLGMANSSEMVMSRIYNYALSAEEVAAHYNGGDPAGYVLPKLYRQFGPNIELTADTFEFNIDSPEYQIVIPSRQYSYDCIYRIDYVVDEWDFQPERYNIVGFNGVAGASIIAGNYLWYTPQQAKIGEVQSCFVKMPMGQSAGVWCFAGEVRSDTTARHLKVTIKGITPVGCVAEYLAKNLVLSRKGPDMELAQNVFEFDKGSPYYMQAIPPSQYPFDCVYRVNYVVDEWNYQPASSTTIGFLGISGAVVLSGDAQWRTVEEARIGKSRSLYVQMPATGSPRLNLYGGLDSQEVIVRRLKVTIKAVTAVSIVSSWLDSAKQLPMNDEYLPPLLQSDGGYDLTASGTPEIIIK